MKKEKISTMTTTRNQKQTCRQSHKTPREPMSEFFIPDKIIQHAKNKVNSGQKNPGEDERTESLKSI